MSQYNNIALVLIDFDGTFTEVDIEAAPYIAAFRDGLAQALHLPPAAFQAEWNEAWRQVSRDPDRWGWRIQGVVMAAGDADPYIHTACAADHILIGRGMAENARIELLKTLYYQHYSAAATAFRPGARETVQALLDHGLPVRVVSNSTTDGVRRKIAHLFDGDIPPGVEIHGDARKMIPTFRPLGEPLFDRLPDAIRPYGAHVRPVWLQRGHYATRLLSLMASVGVGPQQTLFCGDLYELDLALPHALGLRCHLVTRPATAPRDIAAVRAMGNAGSVSEDLGGILEHLGIPTPPVTSPLTPSRT